MKCALNKVIPKYYKIHIKEKSGRRKIYRISAWVVEIMELHQVTTGADREVNEIQKNTTFVIEYHLSTRLVINELNGIME